jgi:hypothetical protein
MVTLTRLVSVILIAILIAIIIDYDCDEDCDYEGGEIPSRLLVGIFVRTFVDKDPNEEGDRNRPGFSRERGNEDAAEARGAPGRFPWRAVGLDGFLR